MSSDKLKKIIDEAKLKLNQAEPNTTASGIIIPERKIILPDGDWTEFEWTYCSDD